MGVNGCIAVGIRRNRLIHTDDEITHGPNNYY